MKPGDMVAHKVVLDAASPEFPGIVLHEGSAASIGYITDDDGDGQLEPLPATTTPPDENMVPVMWKNGDREWEYTADLVSAWDFYGAGDTTAS